MLQYKESGESKRDRGKGIVTTNLGNGVQLGSF